MICRVAVAVLAIAIAAPVAADEYHPPGFGHHHDFSVLEPVARLAVIRDTGRFRVQVVPNLVSYRAALELAGREAAAFCAERGAVDRVVIREADRYSRLRLDAWMFSGYCG